MQGTSLNLSDLQSAREESNLSGAVGRIRVSSSRAARKRSDGRKLFEKFAVLLALVLMTVLATRIFMPAADQSALPSPAEGNDSAAKLQNQQQTGEPKAIHGQETAPEPQGKAAQQQMVEPTSQQTPEDHQGQGSHQGKESHQGQGSQQGQQNQQSPETNGSQASQQSPEMHQTRPNEQTQANPSLIAEPQKQQQASVPTEAAKQQKQSTQTASAETLSGFPRIVWVQTDYELEAKDMGEAMAAQNHIHFGKQDGFEVRIVNNLNAYEWLSEEMIENILDIHQKSKVELPVYELLRLALLYEHGGVFLRPSIILMEGLGWVERLMQGASETEMKALSCQLPGTEVIVYHEKWAEGLRYKDDFIAAKPKAQLFKVLINMTSQVVKELKWPYPKYPVQIEVTYKDTKVVSFPGLTEALITIIHRQKSDVCKNFGVQSFDANAGVFMDAIAQPSKTIQLNEDAFREKRGRRYMLKVRMADIAGDIAYVIKTRDLSCGGGNSLLKNKIMTVEGSKWLTVPSNTTREVRLCVVALAPTPVAVAEQRTMEQIDRLAKQSFGNWTLVSFVEGLPSAFLNLTARAVLVNASVYEGLNLQRAATKYCDPSAVMLLLDYDETLGSENDLQTLAKHFEPIGVFAAFFKLKNGDKLIQPSPIVRGDVMRKLNKPNKEVLSDIGNLMRAFLVETYRFIPAFEMYHSKSGRYFDRELPLLGVLELSERFTPCEDGTIVYQVRRFERLMTIPRVKVFPHIIIQTTRLKVANLSNYEYYSKFRQHQICDVIFFCRKQNAPVEALVVLNNGREEGGLAARRGMPELIPRKIHQIWVKGDIPKFKQFLIQQAREAHPDYEYFLWGKDNFTRQNFPQSYGILQSLMEFDQRSRYNKMAMVADIARNEIAYRHGGFYLDTNYMLYGDRPLDQFLTFSLVTAAEVSSQNRIFRDQAFFGTSQKSSRFARIVSRRVIASRNRFALDAAKETGPGLFGKILYGAEEQDEDVLQPGFEEFYPNFIYDPPRNNYNKCIAPKGTPESDILFKSPKFHYLMNCSQIYSYAYGMDFLEEGGTWIIPRW